MAATINKAPLVNIAAFDIGLLAVKMNRAAELLAVGSPLVKQVAEAVGFADPYHFSRAFKAVHGLSPRAFVLFSRRGAPPEE